MSASVQTRNQTWWVLQEHSDMRPDAKKPVEQPGFLFEAHDPDPDVRFNLPKNCRVSVQLDPWTAGSILTYEYDCPAS